MKLRFQLDLSLVSFRLFSYAYREQIRLKDEEETKVAVVQYKEHLKYHLISIIVLFYFLFFCTFVMMMLKATHR